MGRKGATNKIVQTPSGGAGLRGLRLGALRGSLIAGGGALVGRWAAMVRMGQLGGTLLVEGMSTLIIACMPTLGLLESGGAVEEVDCSPPVSM